MIEHDKEFVDAYYYGLRLIARKRALDEFNARIVQDGGADVWNGTELASITPEAIRYAEEIFPKHYGPKSHNGFTKNWSSIFFHAALQPARFEVAVWQTVEGSRILQGIATGSASHGRENLTLNWVERNFGPEYTRFGVLLPILSCFEHYAHLLGAKRALIKNPVDPTKYERYGYKMTKIQGARSNVVFLEKELKNG